MLAFARKTLFDYLRFTEGGGEVNKSDLVGSVSKMTALTRREAERAVNAVLHTVMREVKAGRSVSLAGFGSFNPTRRKARMGRNPQSGAPVKIAASNGVRFGPSGVFKDVVNGRSALSDVRAPSATVGKKAAKKAAKRAPARVATNSTRKTVGRVPAKKATKKAAKKAAKKTVRKAVRRAPVKKAAKR